MRSANVKRASRRWNLGEEHYGRGDDQMPKTGKMIPTGISVVEERFESSRTLAGGRVQCPECGAIHVWEKSDGVVVDRGSER